MYSRLGLLWVLLGAIVWIGVRPAAAEALYSYVDENGVRVLTNIAPVQPVRDLKMTGSVEPPTAVTTKESDTSRYERLIEKYASAYRLDPSLVRSVIATESGFNERAVSSKGAGGLMQLMPATASRLGVRDTFDPEQNIQGGTKHLRFLLDAFNNDLPLTLAAYNAGENLVQRLGRIPDIKETHDYVRLVTKRYQKNQTLAQASQPDTFPATFRFLDENGVLHLTNIPPVSHAGAAAVYPDTFGH